MARRELRLLIHFYLTANFFFSPSQSLSTIQAKTHLPSDLVAQSFADVLFVKLIRIGCQMLAIVFDNGNIDNSGVGKMIKVTALREKTELRAAIVNA